MHTKKYTTVPMVPGPTSVPSEVLAAMSQDYGSGQIEEDFLDLYATTSKKLARLMQTKNDVVLMTGEGMLALWGALKSCLVKGDKVLSIGTGVFGDGIGEMASSLGCEVKAVSFPYNTTLGSADELNIIEEHIKSFKPKMITAVHCDTPSGTLNPLEALGDLKKKYNVPLLYVDAVASLGGAPVQADKCHIDLLLGGSQKCLSAPPSMSIIGVSQTAWDIMQKIQYQGYDAILPFKTIFADKRCPYTPYWHGVAALNAATDLILAEGMEEVFARHQQVANFCRNELEKLGIELFVHKNSVCAPTVTAAMLPKGCAWPSWQQKLQASGLSIAGSFGPMHGKVFRLGHMGTQANRELVAQALDIIAKNI